MTDVIFDADVPSLPVPVTQRNASKSGATTASTTTPFETSHPVAIIFLYLFRSLSVAVYLLSGFFTINYVLSTLSVVILQALDYYTVRNFSGRLLVGLRYWNQVSETGESVWVFESRPSDSPVNAAESKTFWTALYTFPVVWFALVFLSLVRFNFKFIPLVLLGFAFTLSNAIGFTYADRDAKMKLGSGMMGQMGGMVGGLMGKVMTWGISR